MHGHARARRDTRSVRRPHRGAGLDADAAPRRPGAARGARSRGVSGARLPQRVRWHGEVGRAGRVRGRHGRGGRAGVRRRDRWSTGSSRAGAAGGRAGRGVRRPGRSPGCRPPAYARGGGARAPARVARLCEPSAPDRGRGRLERSSVGGRACVRGVEPSAGCGVVSLPGLHRQPLQRLLRTPHHRARPEAGRSGATGRPDRRPGRPARRHHDERVHAARCPRAAADSRAHPSRRPGAPVGLRAGHGDRLGTARGSCCAPRPRARAASLGGVGRRGAGGLRRQSPPRPVAR